VTIIDFRLPNAADVKLNVFDILGRGVALLVNEKRDAGRYSVQWNAAQFSSGVYFYRIDAGSFTQTKSMVLIK
jgi:hypothetical protein